MTMDKSASEIQKILVEWDPLGDQKSRIPDLNNYETEAEDIDNTNFNDDGTSSTYQYVYCNGG